MPQNTEHETESSGMEIERTSDPVEVEWTDGLDNTHTVRVNPNTGKITVNGRPFPIGSLTAQNVPDWMYRSSPDLQTESGSDTDTPNTNHDSECSDADVSHDYEFEGTFKGREGRFGKVYTDDGNEAWLPKLDGLDEEAYRHGARIAFDTDTEFAEDISFAPTPDIVRAEFIGRDYEYDEVGTVAYMHKKCLFIAIEGREESVEVNQKYIWGAEDVELGDTVALDWFGNRDDLVARGEVR